MQQTENIIEIILNVMEWIYMKFTLLNLVEALQMLITKFRCHHAGQDRRLAVH